MDTPKKYYIANTIHATSFTALLMISITMIGRIALICVLEPSIENVIEMVVTAYFLGPIALFIGIEVVEICRSNAHEYLQTNLVLTWFELVHISFVYGFLTVGVSLMLLTSTPSEIFGNLCLLIFTAPLFSFSGILTLILSVKLWGKYQMSSKISRLWNHHKQSANRWTRNNLRFLY